MLSSTSLELTPSASSISLQEENAHLAGSVTTALFSSVDELLTGAPDVVKVDILAAKKSLGEKSNICIYTN